MAKLIAHRGYKAVAKENTLLSFYAAINGDFCGFEFDVRQSKDGKFVVFHDPVYKGALVKNTKYGKMKKEGIPLLEEVLNLKTNKIMLMEIKDPNIDYLKLIEILKKYSDKNIYIMSFYEKIIKKLNIPSRKYKLGVLNYVLNTEDSHFTYDFIALLESLTFSKTILDFKKRGKEIFIYGMLSKNYKYEYPYYIID